MISILVTISIVWIVILTVCLLGVMSLYQALKIEQGQINKLFDKRHWFLDEKITMVNERVNNMKIKYK
jgi:TM2 domain-containing membrane protein YozV